MKHSIPFSDFAKLDIRIGRVIVASAPEWSQKLLEFTVDFGPEIGEKTILSGVKEWYEPDHFVGNSYMFVVNLEERKMGEGVSQGMMLMADTSEKPMLMPVSSAVAPGTVVR